LFRSVLPVTVALALCPPGPVRAQDAGPGPRVQSAGRDSRAPSAESGQLDASPTLFTVMAAINAAGYNADLASPSNHPLRNRIRADLAKENIPSLAGLRSFFGRHRQNNDNDELAQYISFGLSAGPPPNFAFKVRDNDLPPDVKGMKDLPLLLAAFYKEAHIADLWQQSQPEIEQYLERYHLGISEAVLEVNGYLRQQTSGFRGRRFQIFVELLAPPNQIQTRSYGDIYTIVITPSAEPRIFDVRHAYLHYLLDPLATRYRDILERKKPLADHVLRATALDPALKEDFLLLATESLIKAVEARLDHRPAGIQAALRQGLILAPYFSEKLPVYEKQEQAMLIYYPEMVGAIELVAEDRRLSQVEFDKQAPVRLIHAPPPPEPPPPTGAAKTLEDAEQAYTARNLDKAKSLYLAVLEQTDKQDMHSAAYYGLARIAALENDPEGADKLFEKTLQLQPEPQIKAWALVYRGRLAVAAHESGEARQYFEGALLVEGASQAAQQAACSALKTAASAEGGGAPSPAAAARCAQISKPN
jgi:tetratricopeptide (TPR) repeat protein